MEQKGYNVTHRYDFFLAFHLNENSPQNPVREDLVILDAVKNYISRTVSCWMNWEASYRTYKKYNQNFHPGVSPTYIGENVLKHCRMDAWDMKEKVKCFLCQNFFDIRAFGRSLLFPDGQEKLKGAIQIGLTDTPEHPSYILFRGHITPVLANRNEFTQTDLALFWKSIQALAKEVPTKEIPATLQSAIVFEHNGKFGRAHTESLLHLIHILPVSSRGSITINTEKIPENIQCIDLLKDVSDRSLA